MVFLLLALGAPKTILVYDDLPENSEDPPNMICLLIIAEP